LYDHSFPDANAHQIRRQFEGLCEKMKIHNQVDKAEKLEKLLGRLAKLTYDEDTKSAILEALLLLADRPLDSELVEPSLRESLSRFI
jgi:hypothetical protein